MGQKAPVHMTWRKVKCGRTGRLTDPIAMIGFCDHKAFGPDRNQARVGQQCRWARIIPNRLLTVSRNHGKWRPGLSVEISQIKGPGWYSSPSPLTLLIACVVAMRVGIDWILATISPGPSVKLIELQGCQDHAN